MNIVFTLCSINYLGQAKTLIDSVTKHNPTWKCVLGLVDKNTKCFDLSHFNCEIIEVEKLNIENFSSMVHSYTIVELITAVKPYYFSWLFSTTSAEKIIYFDPDILLFDNLYELEEKMSKYDIILTPHFTKPIKDNFIPTELHVMRTGIYNLGFLALSKSDNSIAMLKWWEEKLAKECIVDLTRGLFVDQLWMNLVPAYFNKVLIEKSAGYNMAHWNLHERKLEVSRENKVMCNDVPLVFYHFSHYNPSKSNEIASFHTRYNFFSRPDIIEIYNYYKSQLIKNDYYKYNKEKCFYIRNENKKKYKRNLEGIMRQVLPNRLKEIVKYIYK